MVGVIHHGCEHTAPEHPLIAFMSDAKATCVVMGYGGRYRCGECKRRVSYDVSDETYARDLEMLPRAEPPYPDGWCGTERVA